MVGENVGRALNDEPHRCDCERVGSAAVTSNEK